MPPFRYFQWRAGISTVRPIFGMGTKPLPVVGSSRIPRPKMMMQRKTLSGKQATGSRSVAAVRAAPANNVKAVATALVNAFAPAVVAPARRVVAARSAVEAPTTAPSYSVQEKTTNPLNLVFVATEVNGDSEWSARKSPISSTPTFSSHLSFLFLRLLPGPRPEAWAMSSEVSPRAFSSPTGRVHDRANALAGLPIELAKRGHNVITIAPRSVKQP